MTAGGKPRRWYAERPRAVAVRALAVRALATVAVCLAASTPVLACPVCFQVEQGPVTDGLRAAVLVLIAVTVGVLAGFGKFIAGFVKRSRSSCP